MRDLQQVYETIKYKAGIGDILEYKFLTANATPSTPYAVFENTPLILLYIMGDTISIGSTNNVSFYDRATAAEIVSGDRSKLNIPTNSSGGHFGAQSTFNTGFPPLLFQNGLQIRQDATYNDNWAGANINYLNWVKFYYIPLPQSFSASSLDYQRLINSIKSKYILNNHFISYLGSATSLTNTAQSIVNGKGGFVTGYYITTEAATISFIKIYDKAIPGDVNVNTDTPIITIRVTNGNGGEHNSIQLSPIPFKYGLQIRTSTGFADNDNTNPGTAVNRFDLFYIIK